jgi:hypothetical protein
VTAAISFVRPEHFKPAAADIGAHGDNDTLPLDIDNRFVKDKADCLAEIAFKYCEELGSGTKKSARQAIDSLLRFAPRC